MSLGAEEPREPLHCAGLARGAVPAPLSRPAPLGRCRGRAGAERCVRRRGTAGAAGRAAGK